MKPFFIPATSKTPSLNLDTQKGLLEIKGKSLPDNPIAFYQPFMECVESYINNANSTTTVNIQFEFCNTESSKSILALLKKLELIVEQDKRVIINWFYKDKDMLEAGENYRMIVNLPFEMHPAAN